MLELNKIYKMDCIKGMKLLPNNSVDLIVTSPPYNIGKGGSAFKFEGYDIYNDNNDNYDKMINLAFKEMYRVLKPSGSLMFNHKVRTVNKKAIHPLIHVFNSDFILKQEIIWDLHDTHIHNKDRFYPINEMIYWCVKDRNKTKFNPDCSEYTTIWQVPRANKKKEGCLHPAPFTIEIPLRCIKTFTSENDVVLDPFMGSGTTAVAAKMLNRNYVGFEISDKYIKVANDRLKSIA